ncbi:hypothetical protein [Streptomyces sp. NBRC 110028]|uniref:hypothetical protein n=1 Tax=Streptomyces sp. NBRC 110028 TaxID=1621260 RepID=UPI000AB67319|nr:hypothetical protein [Streptomyces sp. NBRC 110028]
MASSIASDSDGKNWRYRRRRSTVIRIASLALIRARIISEADAPPVSQDTAARIASSIIRVMTSMMMSKWACWILREDFPWFAAY